MLQRVDAERLARGPAHASRAARDPQPIRVAGRLVAWPMTALVVLGACDRPTDFAGLPSAVVAAGSGTASKHRMQAVVPSKPALAVHEITIEEERYLGDIARQLGATVDGILRDNQLGDRPLAPGMVLKVRTTRDLVEAFESRRVHRKTVKAAAEEARRQAKIKAAAEARAAKRLARLNKRKGRSAKAAVATQGKPGTPAQAARSQNSGSGKVYTVKVRPLGFAGRTTPAARP